MTTTMESSDNALDEIALMSDRELLVDILVRIRRWDAVLDKAEEVAPTVIEAMPRAMEMLDGLMANPLLGAFKWKRHG